MQHKKYSLMGKRKAISPLLAGVLYVVIALATITIVLQVAFPVIASLQDAAAVGQAEKAMRILDQTISLVAREGVGSTRITTLELRKGNFLGVHTE